MGEKIAMGFHSAVDFELKWDVEVLTELAVQYDIHDDDLEMEIPIKTERDLIATSLAHIRAGVGGEFIPESNDLCMRFAEHFSYEQTIGGSATRAAIAISKLGCKSELSMCCSNELITKALPPEINGYSNTTDGSPVVFPHVILTYPAKERIRFNDIDFTTSRGNRLMYSNDADAKNMIVDPAFVSRLKDVKAFLLGCFSEVVDFDILKARMKSTRELLRGLPSDAWMVFEDGCYIEKEFRYYVHRTLHEFIDILSMNEDEMQDYTGKRIDVLDPDAVAEAIREIYEEVNVPVIIIHSAHWALAYGENAQKIISALNRGVCMSSSRFIYGDSFGKVEFEKTAGLPLETIPEGFCNKMKSQFGDRICCIPSINLDFVRHPTLVGLGDFFAGGVILGLSEIKKGE